MNQWKTMNVNKALTFVAHRSFDNEHSANFAATFRDSSLFKSDFSSASQNTGFCPDSSTLGPMSFDNFGI